MRWPASFPSPAIVVAESLRRVREPHLALANVVSHRAADVAPALARCLSPPRDAAPPPAWLRPEQRESFARALAAVRRYGGAMVADPVGSGKSWVAMAVANTLGEAATVIAPATLATQWQRVARRAGVAAEVQTHEAWSRGARVLGDGLVVVDESHRFRHPGIRRYATLAPALRGRRVLLLTGTPVVNRLEDLGTQLALACRDDALLACGTPSLAAALASGLAPLALSHLVIRACPAQAGPARTRVTVPAASAEDAAARRALASLRPLELSAAPSVRRLLHGLLAFALASGMPAAVEALTRYRQLLLQARDAAAAGRRLDRRALQRALAGDIAQLVMWEMLPGDAGADDVRLGDLGRLDAILAGFRREGEGDPPKLARLRQVLSDGRPAIVFAAYRATVHDLRRRLAPRSRIAWCTGEAAGIGTARLPRNTVLEWFRGDGQAAGRQRGGAAPGDLAPLVLVTTDVAAEGLDLQRAARVVHYDLPWTAVRLEQRAGRSARLGSPHASVEEVRLEPPRVLERLLGIRRALARKGGLGLTEDGVPLWAWGPALAARRGVAAGSRGLAAGTCGPVQGLAGFEVLRGGEVAGQLVGALMDGEWREGPAALAAAFAAAEAGGPSRPFGAAARATLRSAAAWARHAAGGGGQPHAAGPEQVAARRRVRAWARAAIRARDHAAIRMAGRALGMLARGLTAGERSLAAALAAAGDADLPALLAQAPDPEADPPVRLRVVGCIHFEPPSP